MNSMHLQVVVFLANAGWLLSCASNASRLVSPQSQFPDQIAVEQARPAAKSLALQDRLVWVEASNPTPKVAAEKLYTFSAKDLPIVKALNLFAQAYKLNLVIDQDVTGSVDIDFRDLPFDQAMTALLRANGYFWAKQGELIYVRLIETRVFSVDYIRLVRSGSGSSQAQVSSGSSDSSGGGGESGETAGAMVIEQSDKVDFWEELEKQLGSLISKSGRLVINRLAGTIQVTDRHKRVEEVRQYIAELNRSIYRQVDIEVKIVEVTLNDDFSLGIDWSRLEQADPGRNQSFSVNNIISQAVGGIPTLTPSVGFVGNRIAGDGTNKLTGILSALKEQGEVNIVSQPRIRTLNNQSALIKVGTDRTFFRKEQQTDTTSAGSSTASTDVPQVVTEGIVLAITPQISLDGWVTMDISPVVTRVSSVTEVKDDNDVVQSTAPNLDISQTSSLVRARNGETIVIGGLIQNQTIESTRAIPWLHRIPILGRLFKGTYSSDVQRELIMFVTPRLIDDTKVFLGEAKLR